MPSPVDLRSDTVTKPTPEMREVMTKAPVGDDVFGEDPSINALQEKAAALLGHEDALFVPSGTMANQLAIKVLTRAGDEVLLEAGSHPYNSESGGAAVFSSVQLHVLNGKRGLLEPEQIENAIRPDDIHCAPTRAVCLENTHNRGGGSIYPIETVAAVREVAKSHGLSMHLDGARLFNACAATGLKPSDYAQYFDTVSFCLSKGLGAPVGSLIAGSKPIIKEALRWRKVLGGGMRQAGILAAAGIYALDHHVAELDGIEIDPVDVETNIVIFQVTHPRLNASNVTNRLKAHGVLVLPWTSDQIRAVTHLDVNRTGVERALTAIETILKES
ncbi:MAG: aminotransferase class I/II-fold pyridoxal phosphate-dependent enzyme [Deltaproteobacteria bacterium]|nr:aminotransferase class I/II-fold pyridoxal phosphate-dependent enzyme [Deltaproteobacteria bacterium]